MKRNYLLSRNLISAVFSLSFLLPSAASAVQPLEEFIEQARSRSFDAREQRAVTDQRDWEKGAALGRLLPSFTARGILQHNQYEVAVQLPGTTQELVISPKNQLDANLQLDVPLVNLANYYRYSQSKHISKAAQIQNDFVGTEVDRAVANSYFSFIGASALADAARESLKMAEENAEYVATRVEFGASVELDLERARANVERAKQDIVDAELVRTMAARNLETLSGISPTPVTQYPEDDLHSEESLESWLQKKDTPSDRMQTELLKAAQDGRKAAKYSLLPTLSANAQQRFTNATGFAGRSSIYTLQAVLSWQLDYGTYAQAQAQAAASEVQQVQAERARRGIEDSIFDAYQRVEAGIAKSRSARAQANAARKAAQLAQERYQSGAATQLDVTQSQREFFAAEAARIQADADLAFSRVSLRVVAGLLDREGQGAARGESAAQSK